jgi:replicative DNA helicase Mcm
MNPEDIIALHEAMESGTLNINKANIHATIPCNTTIIGLANPVGTRFIDNQNLADQIKLPLTILQRFDLIFLMKDNKSKDWKSKVSKHILEWDENGLDQAQPEFLKRYISYAKTFMPKRDKEIQNLIHERYLKIISIMSIPGLECPVPISERQLQSIIRISEASARIRLSHNIEPIDVEYAFRMVTESLKMAGLDVNTGEIDPDLLEGTGSHNRGKIMKFKELLDTEFTNNNMVPESKIVELASNVGLDYNKALEIVFIKRDRGEIFEPTNKMFKKLI